MRERVGVWGIGNVDAESVRRSDWGWVIELVDRAEFNVCPSALRGASTRGLNIVGCWIGVRDGRGAEGSRKSSEMAWHHVNPGHGHLSPSLLPLGPYAVTVSLFIQNAEKLDPDHLGPLTSGVCRPGPVQLLRPNVWRRRATTSTATITKRPQ